MKPLIPIILAILIAIGFVHCSNNTISEIKYKRLCYHLIYNHQDAKVIILDSGQTIPKQAFLSRRMSSVPIAPIDAAWDFAINENKDTSYVTYHHNFDIHDTLEVRKALLDSVILKVIEL